jgi:hypothetical protein
MLDLHCYRFATRARAWPEAAIDFVDGVIEPKAYGFKLNSSTKFGEGRPTSAWKVNSWYLEMKKIAEYALVLIAKAVFAAKLRHRSSQQQPTAVREFESVITGRCVRSNSDVQLHI